MPEQAEPDQYGPAISDLRATAKWILGAFAAVGTTAFAGLQLTSFGDLDRSRDGWRLPVAVLGFVIALAGVAMAITTIGRFLARKPLTLRLLVSDGSKDLAKARESLDGDQTILGQYPDIGAVQQAIHETITTLSEANATLAEGDAGDRDQAVEDSTVAQANLLALQSIARYALGRARLIEANRQYRRVLVKVAFYAAVVAVGAMLFAVATGQPDAREQASMPGIDAAIATDGTARTLTVTVSGDGVDHAAVGTVAATWDDGEVLFEGSFGEEEGLAATELAVPIGAERHGEIEIVATLADGSDDDEVLRSSLTLSVGEPATTSTTTTTTTTTTTPPPPAPPSHCH